MVQTSKPEKSKRQITTAEVKTKRLVDDAGEGTLVLPSVECPVFQVPAW